MGLGSIILGIFSFLLMIAGVIFVFVPFLGTMLSFLSPILAIAGVILGGVAMSRAKQGMGENEGLATAGLVINILAFIPAMLVALTCGLCNTMCTGAFLTPPDSTHQGVPWDRDGGPNSNPFEDLFDPPDAAVAAPTPPPSTPPSTTPPPPMERQGDETPLPPPPLPPGPAGAGAVPRQPASSEPSDTSSDTSSEDGQSDAPAAGPSAVDAEDPPADRRRRRRASQ